MPLDILSTSDDSRNASLDELIRAAKEQRGSPFWLSEGPVMKHGKLDPVAVDITRLERRGRHFTLPTSAAEHPDPFDLDNLLFVAPKRVREFQRQLESAAKRAKRHNKLVLPVIGNGGTIATVKNGKEFVPELSAEEVVDHGGKSLRNMFEVVAFDLMAIDSSQYQWSFTGDCTIAMSNTMAKASADLRERICWMVFNGTDTCVEGASNLKAQLGPEFPAGVGFACSNMDLGHRATDAPVNILCTAQELAYQHKLKYQGVFLHAGGNNTGPINPFWAEKARDGHVNIFESPYGDRNADIAHFFSTGYTDAFAKQYREAILPSSNRTFSPVILDGPSFGAGRGVDLGNPATVLDSRVGESPLEVLLQLRVAGALGKRWAIKNTYGSFTAFQQKLSILKAMAPDINIIATSPFAKGGQHEYPSALFIRDELDGVITTMSEHATMIKLMLAEMLWPQDVKRQREFLAEHDYSGEQTRYNKPTYAYVGTPSELHQRKFRARKASA